MNIMSKKKIIDEFSDIPDRCIRWRLRHPEKYKNFRESYQKDYDKNRRLEINLKRSEARKEIIRLLSGRCSNPYNLPHPDWCNDPQILQIDHINADGKKDKKFGGGLTIHILLEIQKGSKDYQLLCPNCNWLKRIKNHERKEPKEGLHF